MIGINILSRGVHRGQGNSQDFDGTRKTHCEKRAPNRAVALWTSRGTGRLTAKHCLESPSHHALKTNVNRKKDINFDK